jgi:VanZ family protein
LKTPLGTNPGVWKAWLAALLWLGLIVFESTNALSAEKTGHFLYPLLHFLLGLDPVRFLTWHFVIRKTGHIVGYSVLTLLFFRALRVTIQVTGSPRWSIVWAGIAFGMTALVASLDEWHQSFLPSRTGNIRDVTLDSAAALVTQVLIYAWLRGGRDQDRTLPHLSHSALMSSEEAREGITRESAKG